MKYAINRLNNKRIYIDDALRGRLAGTKCPDCGENVLARQGDVRDHHFAHISKTNCNGESDLHYRAKSMIYKSKQAPYFPYPLENNVKKIKRHKFVDAWMEANVGDFNVDFLLRDAQDKRLAVEITVTHKTEKAKIDFFKKIDLTAIEIDLSKYHKKNMNESDLRKSIFFTPNNVNYLNSNSIDKRNELRQKQINETLKNH